MFQLLDQGTPRAYIGIHPLVLRKVAEVLGLDPIFLFQLAGYLPAEDIAQPLSLQAHYFAVCFDTLPIPQQRLLIDMIQSLTTSTGIPPRATRTQKLLEHTEALRQQHLLFREQPFGIRLEMGRIIGNLTHTPATF